MKGVKGVKGLKCLRGVRGSDDRPKVHIGMWIVRVEMSDCEGFERCERFR